MNDRTAFDPALLDELILSTDLQPAKKYETSPKLDDIVTKPSGEMNAIPTIEGVYSKLNELTEISTSILNMAKYIVESSPDGEQIAGVSSLINSVKGCLKEFTQIHRDKIQFDRKKELEELKFQNKIKYAEIQQKIKSNDIDPSIEDLVSYSQEDIIRQAIKIETDEFHIKQII